MLNLPRLPIPATTPTKTALGRWMEGQRLNGHEHPVTHPWYKILWLTGVDYFSTLGYQPGIALIAAGALSPFATLILILVTLFCALPVYMQVASRSYIGQGSIAMLENLLPGWWGKLMILILIGFVSTDYLITMTLSAADAALHAVENPYLSPYLGGHQMGSTLFLLVLLGMVFLKGMKEAIGLAMATAIPYIFLNLIIIIRGFMEIANHPEYFQNWRHTLEIHGDIGSLLLISVLTFPKLALGLSGFETGVAVMPWMKDQAKMAEGSYPIDRIRGTRKLLIAAAIIMSFLLLASSWITTLLIPPEASRAGGQAAGRALAYLAHQLLGSTFGTIYDFVTIAILWFAGASAMAGMLSLIPRYLPKLGMAPQWTIHSRPLILLLFSINVFITLFFHADVEAQAGAYATGVLVVMLSASMAVAISLWKGESDALSKPAAAKLKSIYFWIVTLIFCYTLIDNVIGRPDGLIIATCFSLAILIFGGLSRYRRATELRVSEIVFADEESEAFWPMLLKRQVNLVPISTGSPDMRKRKIKMIRERYTTKAPIAFVHVDLLDNRSTFMASLKLKIRKEEGHYLLSISGAVATANTVAYLSELMDPACIFLTLSRKNIIMQSFRYFLLGEGEVGLSVYMILLRYWKWTPEDDLRPTIFLVSE